jgi:predicted nucleic acid-binding protein
LIYFVEKIEPYLTASLPLWQAVDSGRLRVAISELGLLETLVKPLRDGDSALADLYRQLLLEATDVECVPLRRDILESAARLRASTGLRTPDAIHAATAMAAGCALFVTNDRVFRTVPGLNAVILSELATT